MYFLLLNCITGSNLTPFATGLLHPLGYTHCHTSTLTTATHVWVLHISREAVLRVMAETERRGPWSVVRVAEVLEKVEGVEAGREGMMELARRGEWVKVEAGKGFVEGFLERWCFIVVAGSARIQVVSLCNEFPRFGTQTRDKARFAKPIKRLLVEKEIPKMTLFEPWVDWKANAKQSDLDACRSGSGSGGEQEVQVQLVAGDGGCLCFYFAGEEEE
ncbi:hypothetical protein HDU98_002427 [Podochytrium sp. JEL0797]|nr:hypothetical protein HDU98_002427 [Podochytrium sp. JEL0797]